jgi:ABC-2 type transport system permease protein
MNIFIRELRANRKSLLIWCGAQFFLIYAGMFKYGSIAGSNVDLNALLGQFPKGLLSIFGMGQLDLSRIEGFYSIVFLYFMLLAAIHAAMLGAVLISKEERDHSADFLFAKPIRRNQVITAKLAAGLLNILVFNLLTFAASLYCISINNGGNSLSDKISIMMLALLMLQLLFLCFGAALGAVLKTTQKATSMITGVLLGTFFVAIGVDIDERIAFLKYVTPFKYFEASSLMYGGRYQVSSIIICTVLTGLFLYVTYAKFGQRDLTV